MAEANGLGMPLLCKNLASGSIIKKTTNDKNTGAAIWYSLLNMYMTRKTVSTMNPISTKVRQYFLYNGSIAGGSLLFTTDYFSLYTIYKKTPISSVTVIK